MTTVVELNKSNGGNNTGGNGNNDGKVFTVVAPVTPDGRYLDYSTVKGTISDAERMGYDSIYVEMRVFDPQPKQMLPELVEDFEPFDDELGLDEPNTLPNNYDTAPDELGGGPLPEYEGPKSVVDLADFNFDSTASHIQWNPKARWYSMSECVNIKEAAGYLLGSTARHATKMLHTPRMRRALCCQQFNGAGSLLYFPKEAVVANKRKMPVS